MRGCTGQLLRFVITTGVMFGEGHLVRTRDVAQGFLLIVGWSHDASPEEDDEDEDDNADAAAVDGDNADGNE